MRDAVKFSIEGALSALTYVRADGALHVGPDESATEITVRATTLDGAEFTGEVTVTLTEDKVDYWSAFKPIPPAEGGDGSGNGTGDGTE